MAFACCTFAQTIDPIQDALINSNNTNVPKDDVEKLSPFMKKVKDETFKTFVVSEIKENSIGFDYSGFECTISETDNILQTTFYCQISKRIPTYKLQSLTNWLNLISDVDRLDYKYIAFPISEEYIDGDGILCKMRVLKPNKVMSEDDIKNHIKTLMSWMDKTRSILSLSEVGLENYSEDILDKKRFENLPLKFLRIYCDFPMYVIQYEIPLSGPLSGIQFLGYRYPICSNKFVNDSQNDKKVFNGMLEDIKEDHNGKNIKVAEATYNGIKFKKISYEGLEEGIKRDCCIYYTNLNNEKIFFTTATNYPRSAEDQKIIDKMIEKRIADKMPVLGPKQSDKEQDKESQEK